MKKFKAVYGGEISVWQESSSLIGIQIELPNVEGKTGLLLSGTAAREFLQELKDILSQVFGD